MFVKNGVPLGDLGRGFAARAGGARGGFNRGFSRAAFARGRAFNRGFSRTFARHAALSRAAFGHRPGAPWMGFGTRANWLRYMAYLGRTATYGATGAGGGPGIGGGGGGSDSGGGAASGGGGGSQDMDAGSRSGGDDSQEIQQLEQEIQALQAQMQQQAQQPIGSRGGVPHTEASGKLLISQLDAADHIHGAQPMGDFRGGRGYRGGYRGEFRNGVRGFGDRFRGWLGTEIDRFHPGAEWGGHRWRWDPYRHRFVEV